MVVVKGLNCMKEYVLTCLFETLDAPFYMKDFKFEPPGGVRGYPPVALNQSDHTLHISSHTIFSGIKRLPGKQFNLQGMVSQPIEPTLDLQINCRVPE